MTRPEYIRKFTAVVLQATAGSGLFPSVTMAQALLESADSNGIPGRSVLASAYNNHFGIKADKNWKGRKVKLKTREMIAGESIMVRDFFRAYDDAVSSFVDRVEFLKSNKRYINAGVFQATTAGEQADALQAAGYATDPKYASILKQLIAKYNLTDLDKMAGSQLT